MIGIFRKFSMLVVLLGNAGLIGCDARNQAKYSSDINTFRELIVLDFDFKSVRWEVFTTPEYVDGIPGPTDYVTLIAEIEASDLSSFQGQPEHGSVWIVPRAGRPWLSKKFFDFLDSYANKKMELPAKFLCRKIRSQSKKATRIIEGIACTDSKHILLYMDLSVP